MERGVISVPSVSMWARILAHEQTAQGTLSCFSLSLLCIILLHFRCCKPDALVTERALQQALDSVFLAASA